MNVLDRQRVHVDQDRRLHRLERVVRAVAVVVAGLIALEATGVDCGFTAPARLLRRNAEQATEFTHLVLFLPPAEGRMVWRGFEIQFLTDGERVVKPRFGLAEAFVEFSVHENQGDLNPLGEPAVAIRRSGFVWVVSVLFAKVLTRLHQRSFRPHTARQRPIPPSISRNHSQTDCTVR